MIKGMPFDYDATLSDETQYTAEFTRNFIKSELTNGVYPLNFVQGGSTNAANAIGTCFAVKRATNTSRTLVVCPGTAVIDGLRILSDTDVEVDVPSVTGIGVFDIVLQADFTAQKVTIICQQRDIDTSAARANAMIRTGIKYQLCLATVKTTDHSITYLQDTRLITDRCADGKPLCGLVSSIYQTDTASVIKMMDDYIDALANKIIQGSNLADRSVTTDKLDNGAVTFDKIALHAVKGGVNGNIAPGTIDSYNIKESGVLEENIDDDAVTTSKITDGAVTAEKLAEELKNSVGDKSIKDFEHVTGDGTLQFDSYYGKGDDLHIYRIKSADKAFYNSFDISRGDVCYFVPNAAEQYLFVPVRGKLFIRRSVIGGFPMAWTEVHTEPAENSVTTEKIVGGAVTTDKLADHSVTSTKLANGAVTHGTIAANAIVAENISKGAVTAGKLSADVANKIDSNTADIAQNTADITKLKTDTLDNTEAITQNTADIDELKVKSLASVKLTLPTGITTIPDIAFCANQSLVSVTIPSDITSIGIGAFQRCKNLESATIGSGVKSIGNSAFAYCTSLKSITIPDSVTSIGLYAFNNCTSLTSITISDRVTNIADGTFNGCTNLTSITIPDSITSVGNGAFSGCTKLENVTLANGFNANNLDLSASTKYTADAIVSWLNALADRTGQTAYTLKIGATNKAKLTAEQLAIATNKNWNIA